MKGNKLLLLAALCMVTVAQAQRQYASNSVLANGTWIKIATTGEGLYKVDFSFLASAGIATNALTSASIRLFGNGGGMMPENNFAVRVDDLVENAIEIADGGDGVFGPGDYFIFYAAGSDRWLKDSLAQSFRHQKNVYSNESFYFITIGGVGRRVGTKAAGASPNTSVNSYDTRLFHETDTLNFLNSGRQWYGEEFSNTPGNSLVRFFGLSIPDIITTSPVSVISKVVARSVGAGSRFELRLNGQLFPSLNLPAVSGNVLDAFAAETEQKFQGMVSSPNINLNYNYTPGSFNGQGWMNWFEMFARSQLRMSAGQLNFRDWRSVGVGNLAEFVLQNANNNTRVWEITNPLNPEKVPSTISGSELRFNNDATRLREYIAFNESSFLVPATVGRINNQNLHNSSPADYLIISPEFFRQEAQRLAHFHTQRYGYKVVAVSTSEVFNEFGSGSADPVAIRDFVKMYYDKAGTDSTKRPKYLLLFGDGSFDYKNRIANNTNLVPCYESENSLDPLSTYTSDDFFGLLDDVDDINLTSPPGQLDIGIGRIPASTLAQAKTMVDKIIHYHSAATLGAWRNQITFVADDEDANLHLQDAELISSNTAATNPLFNQYKIYLDAYRQESGSGGSRYPSANKAIINQMYNGNLVWNYNGHGGSKRLADEAILDDDVAKQFNNPDKLPLYITATCDFAPYDDPTLPSSIGESMLLNDVKGAIALTTTTRLVFAFSNRIINNNYLQFALKPDATNKYLTLGEAMRRAKNLTYISSGDINNNRKFTLLGDPAMKLAFPELRLTVNSINGGTPIGTDTLKALTRYTISGQVVDDAGNLLPGFNGSVYPTIYDKPVTVQTLQNDATSPATTFQQQTNVVYKGKVSAVNGQYSFSFIVPKDINYQAGNGKISLYAENGSTDGNGIFTNFKIGGTGTGSITDKEGPDIRAFLNDERFVNGGLTNDQPILVLKLSDSSGINTVGTAIGHDITVVIDGDEKNTLVLNDFYQADLDSYQKGTIKFQLPALTNGAHTLKIKAWDVANNSSEYILDFIVAASNTLQINHVINYPNPFTSNTNFWFEHNQPGTNLKVLIQIFSVSGKLVHQIQRIINTQGNLSNSIGWNGKDSYQNKLARGVYIYKLSVTGADANTVEKIEKLYML